MAASSSTTAPKMVSSRIYGLFVNTAARPPRLWCHSSLPHCSSGVPAVCIHDAGGELIRSGSFGSASLARLSNATKTVASASFLGIYYPHARQSSQVARAKFRTGSSRSRALWSLELGSRIAFPTPALTSMTFSWRPVNSQIDHPAQIALEHQNYSRKAPFALEPQP